MRHGRIIGMVLAVLTLAWQAPATGAEALTLEALPVSAGAVELRWNQAVNSMIERQAAGGEFEQVRRSGGKVGTYFDRGLAADTEYTYRIGVPNGWYDFGPPGTPHEIDFQRVSQEDVYSPDKGFGFGEPDGGAGKRGRGNPVMLSHVSGPSTFIQDVPNGRYLVSVGGRHLHDFIDYQVTINGAEALPRTKAAARGRPVELIDYPVDVTDGKITVELGANRVWNYLKIVSEAEPVKALATATVKTHSIAHMVGILRDDKKPLADRLAALYSLGDMAAAAAPAAPAVAAVLLETEKDKDPMHWLALWALWKIGPEHVGERTQRAAAQEILARFEEYDKTVLPMPAHSLIQEANADYPLFGQHPWRQADMPDEKVPPNVKFFGRWDAAAGKWEDYYNPYGEIGYANKNSVVNMHLRPDSKWEIGEDEWGKIVRVNMLKMTAADWGNVPGVKKAWLMPDAPGFLAGDETEEGMAFHPVISEVKDIDGDGKPDVFRLRSWRPGTRIQRLRHDDGSVVWESAQVGAYAGDESRLAVAELTGPGDWAVFYSDKNGSYCFDAATGETRWTSKYGAIYDGMFTVGNFLDRNKSAMVVRAGKTIYCLDETGELAWQYAIDGLTRNRAEYGHEMMRGDADGDGLDEVFANMNNRTLALRGDGKLMWEDRTQHFHSDFLDLLDVDGDGRKELVYDHSGCSAANGPVMIVDAITGEVKTTIRYKGIIKGLGHVQNAAIGKFDPSRPGMQLALCDKNSLLTLWDMATGELIWHRPIPTSLLSRGDWNGDGVDEIMVFALGANVDGMFSVWNGKGERLYAISFLPSPSNRVWEAGRRGGWSHAMPGGHEGLRRQIDLDGNGLADVIMPFGAWGWGSDSILFLMERPAKELLPDASRAAGN